MEKHYIYKITSPSGKCYIGRTKDFKHRMHEHKTAASRGVKRPLYSAIRKYGWDNMIKEVVGEANNYEEAYEMELRFIFHYNSLLEGYNATNNTKDGGDVWKGQRNTKKFRDFVEKMRVVTSALDPNRPHNHSEETKLSQKRAAIGRYTLPWFQSKYGIEDGLKMYEERNKKLRERNLKKDSVTGRFIK